MSEPKAGGAAGPQEPPPLEELEIRALAKRLEECWRDGIECPSQSDLKRAADKLRILLAALKIAALRDAARVPPSQAVPDALGTLRDTIQRLKDGTRCDTAPRGGSGKHRRASERREVETIHKTLNVVLAEIDNLRVARVPPSHEPLTDEQWRGLPDWLRTFLIEARVSGSLKVQEILDALEQAALRAAPVTPPQQESIKLYVVRALQSCGDTREIELEKLAAFLGIDNPCAEDAEDRIRASYAATPPQEPPK